MRSVSILGSECLYFMLSEVACFGVSYKCPYKVGTQYTYASAGLRFIYFPQLFTFKEADKNNRFVSSILPSSLCFQQDKLKLSMNLATRFCLWWLALRTHQRTRQNSQKRQTTRKKGENFYAFPSPTN